MSDLQPNPPSTTPPDAVPQPATPETATKHPQPELRSLELETPTKPKREPLNPAYAILGAAILSAGTAITATYLNIRSSERLQRERDRTEAATKESNDLKAQLAALQTKLNETSNAVDALAQSTDAAPQSSTLPVATVPVATALPTAAPLPSIIVVLPSTPPTVLTITPTVKPESKPEARVEPATTPVPTQPSTSTTIPSPTIPSATLSTLVSPVTTPSPAAATAALPSTVTTTSTKVP